MHKNISTISIGLKQPFGIEGSQLIFDLMQPGVEMNVQYDLSICWLKPSYFSNRMCRAFLWRQTECSELSFAFEQPQCLRLLTLCSGLLGPMGKMFKQ